jgi:hypothetical protein
MLLSCTTGAPAQREERAPHLARSLSLIREWDIFCSAGGCLSPEAQRRRKAAPHDRRRSSKPTGSGNSPTRRTLATETWIELAASAAGPAIGVDRATFAHETARRPHSFARAGWMKGHKTSRWRVRDEGPHRQNSARARRAGAQCRLARHLLLRARHSTAERRLVWAQSKTRARRSSSATAAERSRA